MMKKIYRIMALFLIAVLAMPAGVFAAGEEISARFSNPDDLDDFYVGESRVINYYCKPANRFEELIFDTKTISLEGEAEPEEQASPEDPEGQSESSEPAELEKILEIQVIDHEQVRVTALRAGQAKLMIYANEEAHANGQALTDEIVDVTEPYTVTFQAGEEGYFKTDDGEKAAEWKTLAAKYRGLWDIPQPDVYANNEEMIFSEWSLEAGGELLSDTYFNDTTLSEDGLVFYANYTSRERADKVLQSMKEMAEATYEKSEQAQNAIAAAEEAYNGLMRGEKKAIQKDAEAYLQQAQEKADKLKQQEENPKTPSGNNNSGNSSSGSNSGSGTASGGQSGAGGKSGSASGAVNPYTTSSFGNYMSPVIIVNPLAATKFTSVKAGKAGSRKILLKWKKKKKIDGYQIQYSTKKSFKKGVKTINIKKAKTTKKTIKKLKKGRKYFVRIRTYKMVNGTPFYGAWSNVKSVRVK